MPNPVVHFEIGCGDNDAARAFFSELFGWNVGDQEGGYMIDTGGPITGHLSALAAEWGQYVTVYVEVDDLDAYLERVTELGGKVLVPPVTIPQGSFAWFAAPEGNILGLWKAA